MSTISNFTPWKKHTTGDKGDPITYSFLEKITSSWQYLVTDPVSSKAVIIDPALNYDGTGTVATDSADGILSFIKQNKFDVQRIMETHAHADHLSASNYIKNKLSNKPPVCIGDRIGLVQDTFGPRYGYQASDMDKDFDILLKDNEEFKIGELTCRVMLLSGHTPDHLGYQIGKSVFTGDSIFLPYLGSARADFPGGDAKSLYHSIQRLLSLPENYEIFVGHDYPSAGSEINCVSTVAEQKQLNKHAKSGTTEDEFISFREARDKVLGQPKFLHLSLQVNIRAGRLPPMYNDGRLKSVEKPLTP